MFVLFHTDGGNYGLTGTRGDPGFYAEWQILDNGQACTRFTQLPGTAIRGHNNEQLRDLTVAECEDACCVREWCKSFDYLDIADQVHCNLADVDATRQFGDVTTSATWDLYERPEASIAMTVRLLLPHFTLLYSYLIVPHLPHLWLQMDMCLRSWLRWVTLAALRC